MQARRRPLHCACGSIPWARMLQALMVKRGRMPNPRYFVFFLIVFFSVNTFADACGQGPSESEKRERVAFCMAKFEEYKERLTTFQEGIVPSDIEQIEELRAYIAGRNDEHLACSVDLGGIGGLSVETQTQNQLAFAGVRDNAKAYVVITESGAPSGVTKKLGTRLEQAVSDLKDSIKVFLNHEYPSRKMASSPCR